MQGDIFMLDQTTAQATAQTASTTKGKMNNKVEAVAAQVAIYNEDDLSHLLYTSPSHHHHHHHHNHNHHDGSLTPLTAPASSGTHTPLFSDHGADGSGLSDSESAVFEDWEMHQQAGELDLEFEIPPSPVPRRRGGTMCSSDDDFEWPVFLGRQSDEVVVGVPSASAARRRSSASSASRPGSIGGAASAATPPTTRVPHEHHVGSIGGPLMALWPAAAVDVLEWNERFYE